jgi:hypothetical protein
MNTNQSLEEQLIRDGAGGSGLPSNGQGLFEDTFDLRLLLFGDPLQNGRDLAGGESAARIPHYRTIHRVTVRSGRSAKSEVHQKNGNCGKRSD